MLTTRDLSILDFLDTYKIASTSTIAELFFPSKISCYKRLQTMYNEKVIKRSRESLNNEFIYYKKNPPKQYKHRLLVTDFYRELHKRTTVVSFKPECVLENIRPDAVFAYKLNGKTYLGLLEVEISNKGFSNKYEGFYTSELYKKFFPVFPQIYVIGSRIKLPQNAKNNYIIIDDKLSNFRLS
jgi:hypothetical protein